MSTTTVLRALHVALYLAAACVAVTSATLLALAVIVAGLGLRVGLSRAGRRPAVTTHGAGVAAVPSTRSVGSVTWKVHA